ncbi:hypothetical protein NFD60_12695 (plasmid) [Staphylococcus epidermidis]|nr:hypothetical protein NFD60_12695 [Staphylococcus epidermidis]
MSNFGKFTALSVPLADLSAVDWFAVSSDCSFDELSVDLSSSFTCSED